jgi:predicted dehydrogenase
MDRRSFLVAAGALLAAPVWASDGRKLRVAVIGHTGRGNYGHGVDTMWLQLPETEIVAVADADAEGLAKAKLRLKVAAGFSDYRAMLAQVKPDVVAVAPRFVDEHRDMLLACAAAGVRGVYMEKPFCRTPAESDEILAACGKSGMKVAVAHRNRWHPVLPVLRKLIAEGRIGRVLEVRTRGKEDRRGGAEDIFVLGGHLFNLAVCFTGQPTACAATLTQDGRPVAASDVKPGAEGIGPLGGDALHARFDTAGGIPIFFDSVANAGVAAAGFGVQVIGTKGVFDLRIDQEPLAFFCEGSPFASTNGERRWVPVSSAGIGVPEPLPDLGKQLASHVFQGRELIGCLRQGGEPTCGLADAALTVEMTCATFESHRQGGARVELPLRQRENALGLLR